MKERILSNKYKAKNKKIKEENEGYCRWKRNFKEKKKMLKIDKIQRINKIILNRKEEIRNGIDTIKKNKNKDSSGKKKKKRWCLWFMIK